MAIKYLSNISLEGNELQNVKIHPVGTAPSNGQGKLYYDTATNKLMANNGSAWYSVNGDLESLGSGDTNTLTIGGTATAPTVSAVTSAIIDGGTGLATADQIHSFVTTQIGAIAGETTTSISLSSNILTYTDEAGTDTDLDLSLYLDDSNLARLTSGSLNGSTGLATFSRSDSSVFTIDMSDFLDAITLNNTLTSTSTTEGLTAAQGKVLKDSIDALVDEDTQLTDAEIAAMGYIKDYTVTQGDVTAHQAALSITESQISDLNHFSGAYADLSGKPTIPTNNNQLTNGNAYISDYTVTQGDVTGHQAALSITESQISDLSHFSGSYTDLTNVPSTIGAQDLSISSNVISISDGSGITLYDQTLNTTDNVEFNDITADKIYLDPEGMAGPAIGSTANIYAKSTATSGNKAGVWTQFDTAASGTSSVYSTAQVVMAKMTGAAQQGSATGVDTYARYEGTGGFTGSIAALTAAGSYRGSDAGANNGGSNFVMGGNITADVQAGSSGLLEYARAANIDSIINNGASVAYAQGAHIGVNLNGGTVTDDVDVVLLDWDQSGGTIGGDFNYLRLGGPSDVAPTSITGDAKAINSPVDIPSEFAGTMEAKSFIKTSGTASQFLKADGTVDSSSYITGYAVTQGDVTGHQAALSITESQISDLNHFSGAYGDLSGLPSLAPSTAEQNVQSDWNAASGDAHILNKPTIPAAASAASTTVAGIIEIATNTEAKAGTLTNRAVTPQGLQQSVDQEHTANRASVLIGNGSSTALTATHNFGDANVMVSILEVSTNEIVFAQTELGTNAVTVTFASAPATNAFKVSMFKMS